MPEEKVEEVAKPEAKGGMMKKMMFVIAIALASSLSGGVVSWILTTRTMANAGNASKEEQSGATEPSKEDSVVDALEKGGVMPMDPFVVNLADADSARYLRIKVSLMVDDKTKMQQIEDNQALQVTLRGVILQTLTQKTSQDINNDDGKNKLRHEIQAKIEGYFKTPKLVDVMFTDFVIQL